MQQTLSGIRQSQWGRSRLPNRIWAISSQWFLSLQCAYHTSAPCAALLAFSPTQAARTIQDEILLPRRPRRRGEAAFYEEDLTFSEALRQGISNAISNLQGPAVDEEKPQFKPKFPTSAMYGQWHSLSLDEDRLLVETDFSDSDDRTVLLVDQPGNANDVQLWTCLLDFCFRRMQSEGVVKIWHALDQRRALFRVEGPLAEFFWATILSVALSNRQMLREVFDYAGWLRTAHDVKWPRLYTTVMGHILAIDQHDDLMRYHSRIMQVSEPTEFEVVRFLEDQVARPIRQRSLQKLYSVHSCRNLYDIILPHLFFTGYVTRALQWREILLKHDDGPRSPAARPFLRYVIGYCPQYRLTGEEQKVVMSDRQNWLGGESPTVPSPTRTDSGENFRYMVNQMHGEAVGLSEKKYNDSLGAKWFASSWVSSDFAINVVYTMGIQEIGPLSLQSIALREKSAQGVRDRIEQLGQLGIRLPDTVYVAAIRHYATIGDDKALRGILQSDIHPEVFDDREALNKLLEDCIRAEDWRTYQFTVHTVLAVISQQRSQISNSVLLSCLRWRKEALAVQVLRDMASHDLEVSPATSDSISTYLLHTISPHAKSIDQSHPRFANATRRQLDLQIALIQQLAETRFPPAVQVWQTIVYRLGRERRLHELERLSLYIIDRFQRNATSDQPMWFAHSADVPKAFREDGPFPTFQKLPRDLPLSYPTHPVRQIFDDMLQGAIVRWGFQYTPYTPAQEDEAVGVLELSAAKAAAETEGWPVGGAAFEWLHHQQQQATDDRPEKYHFARGIRLLAMLRDQGLLVQVSTVRSQIKLRLSELYRGNGHYSYKWPGGTKANTQRRRLNRLSLAEALNLCQEAWGSRRPIVPSMAEMEEMLQRVEAKDQNARIAESRLKRSRQAPFRG